MIAFNTLLTVFVRNRLLNKNWVMIEASEMIRAEQVKKGRLIRVPLSWLILVLLVNWST